MARNDECVAAAAVLTALLYDPPAPRAESAEARALTFGAWQWRASLYRDGTAARPEQPARYTVAFDAAGRLTVQADCNRAGGRFQRAGSQLHVAITQSTRAACPPDSLGHTFLRDLAATAGFFILDGSLHLDLGDGSGTMRFERPD